LIAIIDGDVLCFQACKSRQDAGITDGFQVVSLDDTGARESRAYTQDEDMEYAKECYDHFESDLLELLEATYASDYLMAMKGDTNFRRDLYPEYKMTRTRDPIKTNFVVPKLRKIAIARGMAVAAEHMEADDLLRIWAVQCEQAGQDFVICSIDKDLLCIPGTHYRMRAKQIVHVSPAEAMRLYYQQLLSGDQVDNIKGLPGIGPVKAEKALMDCKTEAELQETVVGMYIAAFGDDWKDQLLLNGKLIHIMKTPTDHFSFKDWPVARELCGW